MVNLRPSCTVRHTPVVSLEDFVTWNFAYVYILLGHWHYLEGGYL